MKNKFALTFAILGFATLVCVLLFSRDTKLQYQSRPAQSTESGTPLSPTILTLAEPPAPPVEAAPDASKPPSRPEATKTPEGPKPGPKAQD